MKNKFFYILSLVLVVCGADALTLSDAILKSFENPSYVAPQTELYRLSGRDRFRRFVLNEPQLSFMSSDDGTAESIGVSEIIAFPGKSIALSHLDGERERSAKSEVFAKKYDLANQITQSYLDCATAQATFDQQSSTTSDLETLTNTIRARYESGHGTQSENISAELQLRQQRADFEAAGDKKKIVCRTLANLLRTDQGAIEPVELADDLEEKVIQELGPSTSDEERFRSAIGISEVMASTAWWSQLPDFNLSAVKNHYLYLPGSPSGKEWTMTYSIAVTVPLLFPFYESAEAKRTKSQSAVDKYTAEMQLIHARSEREDAKLIYQRTRRRLQELRTKDLAMAKALMESTLSSYRTGKLGFAELVLARKTLVDLRFQDIQLRNLIISSHLKCLRECNEVASHKVDPE